MSGDMQERADAIRGTPQECSDILRRISQTEERIRRAQAEWLASKPLEIDWEFGVDLLNWIRS
jgi:hypothetical protein